MKKAVTSFWNRCEKVFPDDNDSRFDKEIGIYMALIKNRKNDTHVVKFFVRGQHQISPNEPCLTKTVSQLEEIGWANEFRNCGFSLDQNELNEIQTRAREKVNGMKEIRKTINTGFSYDELIDLIRKKIRQRNRGQWKKKNGRVLITTDAFNEILDEAFSELDECNIHSPKKTIEHLKNCEIITGPVLLRRDDRDGKATRHYAFRM